MIAAYGYALAIVPLLAGAAMLGALWLLNAPARWAERRELSEYDTTEQS